MAKRTSRKQTANQREYSKQVKRIKQAIGRVEKRGYIFEENVLPEKPKRITKRAIQKLKELTSTKLYEKASYVDQTTGEVIKGIEGRKLERKRAAQKAAETRKRNKQAEQEFWSEKDTNKEKEYYPQGGDTIYYNVLSDFITRLSEPTTQFNAYGRKRNEQTYQASERGRSTLYSLTMRTVAEIGESALGWRLQEAGEELTDLLNYVLYGSNAEHIASATSQLATIIVGRNLTMSELMDIADEEERNEDWSSPQ